MNRTPPTRRKCLFVSGGFPPPMMGGSLVYYYHLFSRCTADDVIVVTRTQHDAAEFDRGLPYTILRKRCISHPNWASRLRKLVWLVLQFPMLLMWILKHRVSVLHLGIITRGSAACGWLAARLTRRSLMVSVMGEELTNRGKGRWPMSWGPNRLLDWSMYFALRHCDCVQTVSIFTKNVLMELGVREDRIHVITPGVDLAKTSTTKAIATEISSQLAGKRILLTVGRFIPRKGQDIVLRALPRILESVPDLVYVTAGGGQAINRESLENIIRELRLQKHAFIFKDLNNEAVAWLYDACEVFVMANRTMPNGDTEGYGIVFLEAGAWGKPVIGGRAGGVVDAVDDGVTGILVDGTDVVDVADAIVKLFSNETLAKEMGEAGREKVRKNGWPEKSDQYRKLLDVMTAGSTIEDRLLSR